MINFSQLYLRHDAIVRCDGWRHQKCRIVFTNGCFDLLHPGHLAYLFEAKSLGDRLVIGLNSDASIRRLKGPHRPVMPQHDRALMLSGLAMVDMVVIFDEDTPNQLIADLRPNIHVKGGDYVASQLPEYPIVTSYGGEVKILSFVEGYSTSQLIGRILNQHEGH